MSLLVSNTNRDSVIVQYFNLQEVGRTPTKFSNHIGHGHVKSSAEVYSVFTLTFPIRCHDTH